VSDREKLVEVTVNGSVPSGISRRRALQWVLAAVAASALKPNPVVRGDEASPAEAASQGYGTDPNLLKTYKPGDLWPLVLSAAQRTTANALADVILPKDDLGPAASELGVVDMLDEWISAPYPAQQGDRGPVTSGLDWLETESNKRFAKSFPQLDATQQHAICDDICFHARAKPEFRDAAEFFTRFRSICAAAYYATPQGWKAIGYVGNVALEKFEGPPEEVLKKLGVTQTVA
jgi:hypothetical protein